MALELELRDQKSIMFDAIVQVVKEDYNIDLLKKVTPERCVSTLKRGQKYHARVSHPLEKSSSIL